MDNYPLTFLPTARFEPGTVRSEARALPLSHESKKLKSKIIFLPKDSSMFVTTKIKICDVTTTRVTSPECFSTADRFSLEKNEIPNHKN